MKKRNDYAYHLIISILSFLAILFLVFGNYKSAIFKYSIIFVCLINMIINLFSYYKKKK